MGKFDVFIPKKKISLNLAMTSFILIPRQP